MTFTCTFYLNILLVQFISECFTIKCTSNPSSFINFIDLHRRGGREGRDSVCIPVMENHHLFFVLGFVYTSSFIILKNSFVVLHSPVN